MVPVKGYRLHIDIRTDQLSAPYPGSGAAVQQGLGAGGQVHGQILDAVLVTAGIRDFSCVDRHGLAQIGRIAAQDVLTLV